MESALGGAEFRDVAASSQVFDADRENGLNAIAFDMLEHRKEVLKIPGEISPGIAQCISEFRTLLQAQAIEIIQRFCGNFISAVLSFHRFDPLRFG
jgi:hypothetical protein